MTVGADSVCGVDSAGRKGGEARSILGLVFWL
jgi:hypothetical protein